MKIRLITIRPPIDPPSSAMPRWRSSTNIAPIRPKIAPEAPAVSAFGLTQQRAEAAGQTRDQVDQAEPDAAQVALERLPSRYSAYMLNAEVQQPVVDEARS